MATEEDVRRIALSLPETIEKLWYGTPGYRVKDKGFLRIRSEAEGGLVVWVSDVGEKQALLESEPEKFFTTPHYDGHPLRLAVQKPASYAGWRTTNHRARRRETGAMRFGSVDDLRTVYRQPRRGPVDKVIHRLDRHCVDFLGKSPFFVLSTASADGVCDGSPKGGPPGFVQVLDEQHLAWADFSGNNRLDSFQNVVTNDSVALLFLIPGLDETLRVNGRAELVSEPDLCERLAIDGKAARVAVVVTVEEAYIHCAKALRRAAIWDPTSWLGPADLPSAACIVKDHAAIDADLSLIEEARQRDIHATLWEPGGQAGPPS